MAKGVAIVRDASRSGDRPVFSPNIGLYVLDSCLYIFPTTTIFNGIILVSPLLPFTRRTSPFPQCPSPLLSFPPQRFSFVKSPHYLALNPRACSIAPTGLTNVAGCYIIVLRYVASFSSYQCDVAKSSFVEPTVHCVHSMYMYNIILKLVILD